MIKHGIKSKFKTQAADKSIKRKEKADNYSISRMRMLERAKALAEKKYSVAEIARICQREGLWNSRKGAPFSEHSVRYTLQKEGIKTRPRHRPAPPQDRLKAIFTRSLKNMGFSQGEIEAELKSLIK